MYTIHTYYSTPLHLVGIHTLKSVAKPTLQCQYLLSDRLNVSEEKVINIHQSLPSNRKGAFYVIYGLRVLFFYFRKAESP
jgi:hypothetical protein